MCPLYPTDIYILKERKTVKSNSLTHDRMMIKYNT